VNGCERWFVAAQQTRHRVHEGKRVWGGQRTAQHGGSAIAQCETSCNAGGAVGGIRCARQHGTEKRRRLGWCRRQDGVGVYAVGNGAMVGAFTVMQCGFGARARSPAVTTSRWGGVDAGSGNATAGHAPSAKAVHGAVIVVRGGVDAGRRYTHHAPSCSQRLRGRRVRGDESL
jgi:hypothetical protein